jgi:hypothetical protein
MNTRGTRAGPAAVARRLAPVSLALGLLLFGPARAADARGTPQGAERDAVLLPGDDGPLGHLGRTPTAEEAADRLLEGDRALSRALGGD